MQTFLRLKLTIMLVVAMLLGVATIQSMKVPALASTYKPCGYVLVKANDWLGGHGVDVHSNGMYTNSPSGKECNPDGEVYNLSANPPQYGFGWVCVELVNRLYVTNGWSARLTIPAKYNGQKTYEGAKWLYTLAVAGYYPDLVAHANGSNYKPVPGDMIIHSNGTFGHVTVVDHISGNTLYAVDQNRSLKGWESYAYNPSNDEVSMAGATISGYVHATKNTGSTGVNSDDWPMVGYDPQLTHYNPTETVLTPTNVSNITADWSYSPQYTFGTSPAIVNNIVYISTQSELEAVDAIAHTLKWSFGLGSSYGFDSPTVSNGVVYVGSANGLFAVDALTGVLKWSFTTGTEVQSPVVVNGIAYFGSLDGSFNAVDALTGALKWKNSVGSIYTRPAVANGVVYVSASDGSTYAPLYALDALTGSIIWSYLGNANAPTIANGMVYLEASLGNGNGFGLFAFDAASGIQRWMFPLTNSTGLIPNTLAVANGKVFAGAFSGNSYNLYAVDATTGGLHWSYSFGTIGSAVFPAIANGVFYFATDYGYLFALDVATGAKLWNGPQISGNNTSSLVVANGVVYIGSLPTLYAFHLPGTTP